jgi:hypothetical protein
MKPQTHNHYRFPLTRFDVERTIVVEAVLDSDLIMTMKSESPSQHKMRSPIDETDSMDFVRSIN